jgi:hypothetical protein
MKGVGKMFEKHMILTRGFRNTVENGRITGFQLDVRITYYRGVPLSCVEGFDVTVDGEKFVPDRYAIGGRTYTLAEAEKASEVRWPFGDPLRLLVSKPGGLKPGIHEVEVGQKLRISYHSDEANPSLHIAKKKMTLGE